MNHFVSVVIVLLACSGFAYASSDLCLGTCVIDGSEEVCTFKFSIDIFAGHTGYYEVEGCDGIMPVLGMKRNVTYIFDQTNVTNWFHPLGFAYGPDGVYRNHAELEKGEKNPISAIACDADEGTSDPYCDFPQYQLNGESLCSDDSDCYEDFGLDEYEGVWFSGGRDDWIDAGNFTVTVRIEDPATTEFFYFCHIHEDMSQRIKIVDESNNAIQPEDLIPIPYEYNTRSEFDIACGTTNTTNYEDPSKECPSMSFVCGEADPSNNFLQCMNAIDCAMHVEMRIDLNEDPLVTFMHQMIAHHRNAVQMAKVIIKLNPPSIVCGTNYDGRRLQDCTDTGEDGGTPVETLLWDIVNVQNNQITFMNSWLADNARPEFATCDAPAQTDLSTAVIAGSVAAGSVGVISLGAALVIASRLRKSGAVVA